MTSSGPNLRAIMSINFTLLYAFLLGGVSWLCWPETAESWRLGMISILLALSSIALFIKAIGDIWRHIMRDVKVLRFNRKGRTPRSDEIIKDEAMRKAGMIE